MAEPDGITTHSARAVALTLAIVLLVVGGIAALLISLGGQFILAGIAVAVFGPLLLWRNVMQIRNRQRHGR